MHQIKDKPYLRATSTCAGYNLTVERDFAFVGELISDKVVRLMNGKIKIPT